jgi:hypothetical protein
MPSGSSESRKECDVESCARIFQEPIMSSDAVFLGGGCSRSGPYRRRGWRPTDSKKQCCARAVNPKKAGTRDAYRELPHCVVGGGLPAASELPLRADFCRSGAVLEGRSRAQSCHSRRPKLINSSRGFWPRTPLIVQIMPFPLFLLRLASRFRDVNGWRELQWDVRAYK